MWDLLLSDDEAMIADSLRDYLAGELPIERLRPGASPADPAKLHAGMAALGWFGVGLPEAMGGSGLRLVEEMLVQRECGRLPPRSLPRVRPGRISTCARRACAGRSPSRR